MSFCTASVTLTLETRIFWNDSQCQYGRRTYMNTCVDSFRTVGFPYWGRLARTVLDRTHFSRKKNSIDRFLPLRIIDARQSAQFSVQISVLDRETVRNNIESIGGSKFVRERKMKWMYISHQASWKNTKVDPFNNSHRTRHKTQCTIRSFREHTSFSYFYTVGQKTKPIETFSLLDGTASSINHNSPKE